MALEYWLLEKAKREDPDLESVLLDVLSRSNNVAAAAVVASIAAAKPSLTGEAGFALLSCPSLLKADMGFIREVHVYAEIEMWYRRT